MEELTYADKKVIIDAVRALENGVIATPINVQGKRNVKEILSHIEDLRQKLVENESKKSQELIGIEQNVANLTHDLKTPIAVIAGYAECLEDGVAKDNYPTLIREQAEDMNQMVIKIIDSARSDVTRHHEEKQLISLKTLLKYEESPISAEHSDSYKISIGKAPNVNVFVEESTFKNILINLVTNAIQHGKQENLKIKVSSRVLLGRVQITVRDNGCGIGREDLPHIFERFYKGDKARTDHSTGVGLFYVKECVEGFGGTISVKSKEGKYTKFIISLPAYIDDTPIEVNKSLLRSCLNIFLFPFVYVYDFINVIYQLIMESKKA